MIISTQRFIEGIPGIGKSTLVKKLILEWDNGTLLSGNHAGYPNIKLLFPILCRELNTLRFDDHQDVSPISVLRRLFPDFFYRWKLVKDISEHVMFLVDGVDELRGIEDIKSLSPSMMYVTYLIHYTIIHISGQICFVIYHNSSAELVLRLNW